jgi:hypothetical protein
MEISFGDATENQISNIYAFAYIELLNQVERLRRRSAAVVRSRQLLRSFLSEKQRREFSQNRQIVVIGSLGGRYRLYPHTGACKGLERHGKRWFAVRRFCLHDPEGLLPPADVSLAQMLLLLQDEAAFLAKANVTEQRSTLWNGDWLRRLNAARCERREEAARQGEPDPGLGLRASEVEPLRARLVDAMVERLDLVS